MGIKRTIKRSMTAVLSTSLFVAAAHTAGASSFQVSPGVTYESDAAHGANVLTVDITENYSELDIGVPEPLNQLQTTSEQSRNATREGHRVVGAINASFFDMGAGSTQLPFSIITKNNEIISFGRVSEGREHYRSEPIVFGETRDGKVAIGEYQARAHTEVNGKTVTVDNINATRRSSEAVLFTPAYIDKRTGTNQYGVEIIVEQASGNPESFSFGETLSGTVTAIRDYDAVGNAAIPENGFVISANGDRYDQLKDVSVGDSISVKATINNQWQDASFILGSGPQLVKNGEVNITMDPNSWRYKSQTARTAVGVNASGDKAFMVTLDNADIGELARYMKNIGADRALNFDGGGSTTLVARQHGDEYASVMNRLSAGSERAVSSTLQAISTAPTSELARLVLSRESGTLLVGHEIDMSYTYGMDKYYNPVQVDGSAITWTVSNDIGSMNGNTFTAENNGEGRIQANVNGTQVGSAAVEVTDAFDKWNLSHTQLTLGTGESQQLSVNPALSNGEKLLFDQSQIEWDVSSDIGTITADGTFTAGNEPGSGNITVTLAGQEREIPVSVAAPPMFQDVAHDYWAAEAIEYLAERDIVNGYDDGTYRPGMHLKRSQAAQILVRSFDYDTANRPNPDFADVDSGFHAYDVIAAVADEEIMRGSDGRFRPNGELTRAQMAVILARVFDLESETKQTFQDVDKDYWAYEEIEALAAHGIGRGSDGHFRPGEPVNRAQFAVFMERALEDL
ncbi:Ig-like domain (group 2) [Alteribacillus persepolensis]|uniref:Ig-like domain (Group 2) n=1 Tax=Alteribacillus persepolensis TaxID=568899 RepID=A0A1G8ACC6_9BACI|nr:S-layer homology domain-containing protein [Alteribacillus persepolensis]SDH18527.1 Ig-like domain (group 2) [Alteribacillus persepolensis]